MESTYSVLMSVYQKEQPEYLRASMQSIFNQTVSTNDFVLICDGPLNDSLDKVIYEMKKKHGDVLNIIRFKNNVGLGYALQIGVKACKNKYIARMDSDDICRPSRCEKELAYLNEHLDISIVGSVIEEFATIPDEIIAKRVVPENHAEILKFSKIRNPFNHPSVMYRREDVLKAGNYLDIRYIQDYYLWIDMFALGMKGYNIQEPLVWMRVGNNLFKRRSGKLYAQIQINLFKKMKDSGLISYPQYIMSCIIRTGSSIAPNWMRKFMFESILREH